MNGTCPYCLCRPSVTRIGVTPRGSVFVFYSCAACQFPVDYQLCLDVRRECWCAVDTYPR